MSNVYIPQESDVWKDVMDQVATTGLLTVGQDTVRSLFLTHPARDELQKERDRNLFLESTAAVATELNEGLRRQFEDFEDGMRKEVAHDHTLDPFTRARMKKWFDERKAARERRTGDVAVATDGTVTLPE